MCCNQRGRVGCRLRLVLGLVLLFLLNLSGGPRPGMTASQLISGALAAVTSLVLIVQAYLDQQKERAVQASSDSVDGFGSVARLAELSALEPRSVATTKIAGSSTWLCIPVWRKQDLHLGRSAFQLVQ